MADLRDRLKLGLGDAYAIERELGGGGMSRVFVALEIALGRRVVVKVLAPELAAEVSAERFRREIQFVAQLQHAHIVPVLSAGTADGMPYYTMPLIDGDSLRSRVGRGELPLTEAVSVLRDIARALAYAHAHGIVHRDIKPENVLLSGGSAMVADFGVAKALAASTRDDVAHDAQVVTSVGVAIGTPAYMAPEQGAADPSADSRVDIYAFGVVAYELLTGSTPFAGRPASSALAAHLTEPPESILRRRPNLPPALAALVMQCLEKRPADRPQTADEIVHALETLATPTGVTAATTPAPPATIQPAGAAPASAHRRAAWTAAIVVAAALVAFLGYRGRALVGSRPAPAVTTGSPRAAAPVAASLSDAKSVAVLPFVNMSADPKNEYFSDGMTEELIDALAKVQGLRVAARTSSFAFKGKNEDVSSIGNKLHVSAVVEGSVRREGRRIRVTAQLINTADGFHVWSETYDRSLSDAFEVQDEISRAIVEALSVKLRLVGGGDDAVVKAGTGDPEAHDLYLRGRYLWNQRTPESLRGAERHFLQAIARDSMYSQAYAGLADTYVLMPIYAAAEPLPWLEKARTAALRAVSIDSTNAAAHLSLAYVRLLADYDWAGGATEFEKAIALDPNNATARDWYAVYLTAVGRETDAIAQVQRAQALDPLSLVINVDLAAQWVLAGHPDTAIRQLRALTELDSTFASTPAALCWAYVVKRDYDLATPVCERAVKLAGDQTTVGLLAYTHARSGDTATARAMIDALMTARRKQRVPSMEFVYAYLGVGNAAEALRWLDTAVTEHDPGFANYVADPLLDPLRSDPRFARIRARMNLK